FKKEDEGGFRVDLTVLEPQNLRIDNYQSSEDYPHKGYFHDGIVVAIELKFIRTTQEAKIKTSAKEDYLKIVNDLKQAKESLIKGGRYRNGGGIKGVRGN
ncbi:MAG: hypothetical protein ACYTE3_14275, partial [Planctomycetota bacterium]